jgi:hypothetical protein
MRAGAILRDPHSNKDYLVLGVRSNVNYTVQEVKSGKKFLLRRAGSYIYMGEGEVPELPVVPFRSAGDIVRFTTGRFGGIVGVISANNSSRFHVAVAGSATITVPKTDTTVVPATAEELAAWLVKKN